MNENLAGVEIDIFSLPLEDQVGAIKHLMAEVEESPIGTARVDLLMKGALTYPFTRAELLLAEELVRRTKERLHHFKIINLPSEVQAWVDGQLDAGMPKWTIAGGLADRTGENERVCSAALWKYEKYWKKKRARRMG